MKGTLTIIALVALIIIAAPHPSHASYSELEAYTITYIDGSASIYDEGEGDWIPAERNMPLREGDRLRVGDDSKLEIRARGGTYIRLAQGSVLRVLPYDFETFGFDLERGRAYVNAGKASSVLIDTPLGSASNWSQSVFMVDVGERGMRVSVLDGYVNAYTERDEQRIDAGNTFLVDPDLYSDVRPLGKESAWENWNRKRDRRIFASHKSSRYLPAELSEYSSDFEDNGRWTYSGEYGYVWMPTVSVYAGWAPYRNGRWVWMGGDYVWVAYEPWGWAPYHYGRWVFLPRGGWCWVPPRHREVYWSPGYVAWVYTSSTVAWVPLAPGETYYGHGNYGPGSVNIDININKTVYKTNYRNIHVNNAVTVIDNTTFVKNTNVRGNRIDYSKVIRKENPFVGGRGVLGRPAVEHRKERVAARDYKDLRNPEKERPGKTERGRDITTERSGSREVYDKRKYERDERGIERPARPGNERGEGRVELPARPGDRDERRVEVPGKSGIERGSIVLPQRRAGKEVESREKVERGVEKRRDKEDVVSTPSDRRPDQKRNSEDDRAVREPSGKKANERAAKVEERENKPGPALTRGNVPDPHQREGGSSTPPAMNRANKSNKPDKQDKAETVQKGKEKQAEKKPDNEKNDETPASDRGNGNGRRP